MAASPRDTSLVLILPASPISSPLLLPTHTDDSEGLHQSRRSSQVVPPSSSLTSFRSGHSPLFLSFFSFFSSSSMELFNLHTTFGVAYIGITVSALYESNCVSISVLDCRLTSHPSLQHLRYPFDAVLHLLSPVPPGSTVLQDTGAYSITRQKVLPHICFRPIPSGRSTMVCVR